MNRCPHRAWADPLLPKPRQFLPAARWPAGCRRSSRPERLAVRAKSRIAWGLARGETRAGGTTVVRSQRSFFERVAGLLLPIGQVPDHHVARLLAAGGQQPWHPGKERMSQPRLPGSQPRDEHRASPHPTARHCRPHGRSPTASHPRPPPRDRTAAAAPATPPAISPDPSATDRSRYLPSSCTTPISDRPSAENATPVAPPSGWMCPFLGPVLQVIDDALGAAEHGQLPAVGREIEAVAAIERLHHAAARHVPQPHFVQRDSVVRLKQPAGGQQRCHPAKMRACVRSPNVSQRKSALATGDIPHGHDAALAHIGMRPRRETSHRSGPSSPWRPASRPEQTPPPADRARAQTAAAAAADRSAAADCPARRCRRRIVAA